MIKLASCGGTKGKSSLLIIFTAWLQGLCLKKSIFQCSSRICRSGYLDSGSKGASFNGFSSFCSISHRLGTRGFVGVKKIFHNPFLLGAKRFYCVDPDNVHHSRPTWPRRWFQNLMERSHMENNSFLLRAKNLINGFIAVMIGSGLAEGHRRETLSWDKEDEILDDKSVQQSRKKVVFTGLFEHFKSDAEIATIIGHEVAHVVVRHFAEEISKKLWFVILPLILMVKPDVNIMQFIFVLLIMDIEADYIGLLLIASAGYDPRVAPKVYEKLREIVGDST
ncbi:Mitochondrial metalloendopeptidase OMA1 [Spatholobus suberectus]|nr:Mitochondrial metalloendopeptidase OMA1 [Spatholobus suberectus]